MSVLPPRKSENRGLDHPPNFSVSRQRWPFLQAFLYHIWMPYPQGVCFHEVSCNLGEHAKNDSDILLGCFSKLHRWDFIDEEQLLRSSMLQYLASSACGLGDLGRSWDWDSVWVQFANRSMTASGSLTDGFAPCFPEKSTVWAVETGDDYGQLS